MKNRDLSRILDEMGQMLELRGANPFKVNAYYRASRIIGELKEDIETVAAEDRLRSISGIGVGMAQRISEYLETGRVDEYETLKGEIAPGLVEMLAIPGMGPRTVALVHRELGIETLPALEEAARVGKLRTLPGMGEKKEAVILRGLEVLSRREGRVPLGLVLPRIDAMIEDLEGTRLGKRFAAAGSVRRCRETVGDIDILASSTKPPQLVQAFVQMPWVERVLAAGDTKGSVLVEGALQVDLRVVEARSYGAALQYFTGSKAHNIRLRDIAKTAGLKVNEYGVFRGETRIGGRTEAEVYRLLGLPLVPPELREDRGEIEAARDDALPDLVEVGDLRGDLHVHTRWSDGSGSVAEMAEAARRRGYRYLAVTDHSRSLRVAGGLSETALEEQLDEIEKVNGRMRGFRVLSGAEVEIMADGRLDYPDSLLERLDVVVAALHSVGRGRDEAQVTARVIQALENPHVNILAHPTGRLLGSREPYPVNLEKVFEVARDRGIAVEINAQPDRLDLDDLGCRRARDLGVPLVVSSDAHAPEQLGFADLGVSVARRGWLAKGDILNTLTVGRLMKALH